MDSNRANIEIEKIFRHLRDTANEDYKTMLNLFNSRSFHWALFLGHISVEKLLKALFVKKHQKHSPFTHNLLRLAELSELELTEEYSGWLDTITSFNLEARYDDYKNEFYNKCTPEYTKDWIEKITTLHSWINQKL